jgi:hypothetical protein
MKNLAASLERMKLGMTRREPCLLKGDTVLAEEKTQRANKVFQSSGLWSSPQGRGRRHAA